MTQENKRLASNWTEQLPYDPNDPELESCNSINDVKARLVFFSLEIGQKSSLINYARRRCPANDPILSPEDVVNQAWVKVMACVYKQFETEAGQPIGYLNYKRRFFPYIQAAIDNILNDHYRKKFNLDLVAEEDIAEFQDMMPSGDFLPHDIVAIRETLTELRRLINVLPCIQQVTILGVLAGKTHKQIAEEVESNPKAIKQAAFYAKNNLKNWMQGLL